MERGMVNIKFYKIILFFFYVQNDFKLCIVKFDGNLNVFRRVLKNGVLSFGCFLCK